MNQLMLKVFVEQPSDNAHSTGAPTNPPVKVVLKKMTLHFYVRNAKIFSSDHCITLVTTENLSISDIKM